MKTSLRTGRILGSLNFVAAIMPEGGSSGKRAAAREACCGSALQAFSAKRNGLVVPANALGHAHIWCDGLTRVRSGGFQNRESM
jgi:hypothetical protein